MVEISAADSPVDNHSLCVQQQGCWQAFDAKALCNLAVQVQQNGKVGINRQLPHKGKHVIFGLPFVNGKYSECFVLEGLMQGFHGGYLATAGRAPGCPEIQYHNFATVTFKCVLFSIHVFKLKVGCLNRCGKPRQFVAQLGLWQLGCCRGYGQHADKQQYAEFAAANFVAPAQVRNEALPMCLYGFHPGVSKCK